MSSEDRFGFTPLKRTPGLGFLNGEFWSLTYPERVIKSHAYRHGFLTENIVYHYTSVSAFYSIIGSRGFWAGHVAYMNDSSEVSHGQQFASDLLRRLSHKPFFLPFKHILEEIAAKLETATSTELYVCCFSRAKDDLSQWRAYGGDAGIMIGLKVSDARIHIGSVTSIYTVTYDDYTKARIILSVVMRFFSEYMDDILYYRSNPGTPHDADYIEVMTTEIRQLCIRFKHSAFASEREVRLIVHPRHEHFASKVRFRPSARHIIPYFQTTDLIPEAESLPLLPLSEVMIGPVPNVELVQRGVVGYLRANGYHDTEVSISPIPYRAL